MERTNHIVLNRLLRSKPYLFRKCRYLGLMIFSLAIEMLSLKKFYIYMVQPFDIECVNNTGIL